VIRSGAYAVGTFGGSITTDDGVVADSLSLFIGGTPGDEQVSAIGRVVSGQAAGLRIREGHWVELWPNARVLPSSSVRHNGWHWTYAHRTRAEALAAMLSRGQDGPFTGRKARARR
jgi:hypothetical protein